MEDRWELTNAPDNLENLEPRTCRVDTCPPLSLRSGACDPLCPASARRVAPLCVISGGWAELGTWKAYRD
eukprot:2685468-Pyramimonas_sp.AAC.1